MGLAVVGEVCELRSLLSSIGKCRREGEEEEKRMLGLEGFGHAPTWAQSRWTPLRRLFEHVSACHLFARVASPLGQRMHHSFG